MIRKHKQIITLLTALAIFLVQFAAQLHAADHPFHQEESYCLSLQCAEHEKGFFHAAARSLYDGGFLRDFPALLTETVPSTVRAHYSSRAPPVTAV